MRGDRRKLIYAAKVIDDATNSITARIEGQFGPAKTTKDVPPSMMTDRRLLYKTLLDAGFDLGFAERWPADIDRLCRSQPRRVFHRLARHGFVPGKRAFACNDRVAGPDGGGLLPPTIRGSRHEAIFASSGTIEGWIEGVAKPLRSSTPGIIALSAAAAAPALSLTGYTNSFGFNLFGGSKAGKSALAAAANSFAGTGIVNHLIGLSGSRAALIEAARLHNDRAMCLEEAGAVPGGLKKKRDMLASLTYELASGYDYARHSSSAFEPTYSAFACIFFFTSEHDMDAIALAAGETRDEGERARIIDLLARCPVTETIFDRRPSNVAPSAWKRCAVNRVIELYRALERHHGMALPELASYLCKYRDACRRTIIANADKFVDYFSRDDMSAVDRHRLRNLGFIYGGATIAIRAGVLPFEPKLVREALSMLVPGVKPRVDRFAEVRAIVRNAARKLPRASAVAARGSDALKGYYEKIDGVSRFVFRAADFRSLFGGDVVQYRVAILWLRSTDRLEARRARSNAASARIEERTIRWPDGTSVRSIVFRGHPRPAQGSRRSK